MDQILKTISIRSTSNEINRIIKDCKGVSPTYSMHFCQNEDFFLKIRRKITIPPFKVHHNIKKAKPDKNYLQLFQSIMEQLAPALFPIFESTQYYFDPAEPLRPVFYQINNINNKIFLYLMQLDISFKPHDCTITTPANNDNTPEFCTNSIFMDTDIILLEKTETSADGTITCTIKQPISETWIGEKGRGYFIKGIWIDSELTKFFSSLFLPNGVLSYPYYPFICKYRTISHFYPNFGEKNRLNAIKTLDKAYTFLEPHIEEIEKELKDVGFRSDSSLLASLRALIHEDNDETDRIIWSKEGFLKNLNVKRYLNSKDMTEYELFI